MKKKTVYETPEVKVITLEQECVICAYSKSDYEYGDLDEPDNALEIYIF